MSYLTDFGKKVMEGEKWLRIDTTLMTKSERAEWLMHARMLNHLFELEQAPKYRAQCDDAWGYGKTVEEAESNCASNWARFQKLRKEGKDPLKHSKLSAALIYGIRKIHQAEKDKASLLGV